MRRQETPMRLGRAETASEVGLAAASCQSITAAIRLPHRLDAGCDDQRNRNLQVKPELHRLAGVGRHFYAIRAAFRGPIRSGAVSPRGGWEFAVSRGRQFHRRVLTSYFKGEVSPDEFACCHGLDVNDRSVSPTANPSIKEACPGTAGRENFRILWQRFSSNPYSLGGEPTGD